MAERLATIPYVDSKFNTSTIMENLSSGSVLNMIVGSRLAEVGSDFVKDGESLDIDDYPNSKLPYDFTSYLDLDGNFSSTGWYAYDSSVLFYDDSNGYLRTVDNQQYVTGFSNPVVGMIDSSICSIENNGNAFTNYHTYNMKTGQKSTVTYTDHSFGEYSNRFVWFDYYSKCHYLHHSTVNDAVAKWVLKFSPSKIEKINYNPPSTWPMEINMFGNLWISNNDKKYSTNSGNTWTNIPSSISNNIHHIVQGWSPNNIIVCEKNNSNNSRLELYQYTNFPTSKTKILSYDAFAGGTIESAEFGGFTQDGKMIIGLRFTENIGSAISGSNHNGAILVSPNGGVSNLYRGFTASGYNNNAFKDHTLYSNHMQVNFRIIMSSNYSITTKLTKI